MLLQNIYIEEERYKGVKNIVMTTTAYKTTPQRTIITID